MERLRKRRTMVLITGVMICSVFLFLPPSPGDSSSVRVSTMTIRGLSRTTDKPAISTTAADSINDAAVFTNNNRRHVTKSLSELGTTPSTNSDMLFFNRVPKSGSEMLVLLMTWLQGQNNFKHHRLAGGRDGSDRQLTRLRQEEMLDEIKEMLRDAGGLPTSFDRHVYFTNFSSFGGQNPLYINLIRDPVDKMLSRFYYADLKNRRDPSLFDHCVEVEGQDCRLLQGHSYDLTIPYFCGHEFWCSLLNEKWALEKAKANVERYFKVVGVLEHLNETLSVLEVFLPRYFSGLQNLYFNELLQPHHNKNKHNPRQIKPATRQKLATSLRLEYEFYHFIKSRLLNQYNKAVVAGTAISPSKFPVLYN